MSIHPRRLGLAVLIAGLATTAHGQTIMTSDFEGPSRADASRLLTQGTFGPKMSEIDAIYLDGEAAWVDAQLDLPFSSHRSYLEAIAALPEVPGDAGRNDVGNHTRNEAFFERALNAPDQLRQRAAFALSQIFVVSDQGGGLGGEAMALARYYDMLGQHAFGNYRDLLEAVTLSPVMGRYLSMLGNQKPDPLNNIRPDENYAREIMQLFSIGLVQLNTDGTVKDGNPGLAGIQPIPTYDQNTIRGLAHVFTGFHYGNCLVRDWEWCWPGDTNAGMHTNMIAPEGLNWSNVWTSYHAYSGDKQLLNYAGVSLPAGVLVGTVTEPVAPIAVTPMQNLDIALDNVFNHPNVGPFIAKQLIQRLVMSNPCPAYVGRVASVFNNNGSGVRGDLRAVIRAVMLDPDARRGPSCSTPRGKLREPLLRMTHLWRTFSAADPSGRFDDWYVWWPGQYVPQSVLHARTVFNFYLPDYAPVGEIANGGWVAPEFQIQTDGAVTNFSNILDGLNWNYLNNSTPWVDPDTAKIDTSAEHALSGNVDTLLDRLDLLMMSGSMSAHMRSTLKTYLESIPAGDESGYRRVWEAMWMISVSPEYVIEK